MKKKLAYIIPLCLVVLGGVVYLTLYIAHFRKSPITIAVAGPMSGPRKVAGQAMMKGIRLYADKVNREGGINGRKLELMIFDDKLSEKTALDAASKIAEDKRILLVLGHYSSGTSIAAGRVYRKNGLPAITASATAGTVTESNDWYFRTIANNSFQGAFIAAYASTNLKKASAVVIYDEDSYGKTLSGDFETAAEEVGIKVIKKWGFNGDSKNLDDEIKVIATELRSIKNPGIVFLAAHGGEGSKIVTTLKHSGANYTIFGPDAFTTKSFKGQFDKYPLEKAKPGYYLEGIYAVSPLLLNIGDESAHEFRKNYLETYKEEPFWPAATYYDAMHVAVEAIGNSDVQGEGHTRQDRREIRKALASIHNPDYAVAGLSGLIWFDKNGDSHSPMAVGRYERKLFLPSFTQYTLRPGMETSSDDVLDKVLSGKMIIVKDQTLNKTSVVYTGVDVNEITNLNIKNGTYTMDFYVWFRHAEGLPGHDVVFPNAVKPIEMNEPIVEETENGIAIRTFHIKADFKTDLDFRAFPFDRHELYIKYHHANMRCGELVYVDDVLGMPRSITKENIGTIDLTANTGWRIEGTHHYQDVKSNVSTFGLPKYFDARNRISYSQFNVAVKVTRTELDFLVKRWLPTVFILLFIFLAYFVPYEKIVFRICILMGTLVATAVYHKYHLEELPVEYNTLMGGAFLTHYFLIGIAVWISVWISRLKKAGKEKKVKLLNRVGIISYFPIAIAAAVIIAWLY